MSLVGLLAFHPISRGGSFVDYIWVEKSRRRNGLTRHLFNHTITPIYLIVHSNNTKALRCYGKRGFVCDDGVPYPPALNEIGMVLANPAEQTTLPSSLVTSVWRVGELQEDTVLEIYECVRRDRPDLSTVHVRRILGLDDASSSIVLLHSQ